ncbi:MAG: alpha/beta fold hydrolase [Hyphomonadaceae bacterium]|nr:alpha/beta fold hydrolase [Hyphomonadaceae bacterium]
MAQGVLLIHGIGCGGDVWDRMAPEFHKAGFAVEAPTLFPELRTLDTPPAALCDLRLKDYVDAMSEAAAQMEAQLGQKPIIIGHSMGGLIAQYLAVQGAASAAVFVTPAQPKGCTAFSFKPLRTFSVLFQIGRKKLPRTPVKVGRKGLSWGILNGVDPALHDEIYARMRYDSGGVYTDVMNPEELDETQVQIPTLTIAASHDRATVAKAVRKVGRKYARAPVPGDFIEYPDNAHMIIDEPGTEKMITDIFDWIGRVLPAAKGSEAAPA